jgi:hypothetical protein
MPVLGRAIGVVVREMLEVGVERPLRIAPQSSVIGALLLGGGTPFVVVGFVVGDSRRAFKFGVLMLLRRISGEAILEVLRASDAGVGSMYDGRRSLRVYTIFWVPAFEAILGNLAVL